MSFNLGNWAKQLQCDMCRGDPDPPLDLNLPPDYLDHDVPDDFWDTPPSEPDEGFHFDLPDYYPTLSFPDRGGVTFGFGGKIPAGWPF